MNKMISKGSLSKYSESFHSSPVNLIAMNAVTANGIKAAAKNHIAGTHVPEHASLMLKKGVEAAPKPNGSQWMSAAVSLLENAIAERLGEHGFSLSQNYLLFCDKLEKSNYFLENVIGTFDEDGYSRLAEHIFNNPVPDGCQWDMTASLIRKYGVVPQEYMPGNSNAASVKEMNGFLAELLRSFAAKLYRMHGMGKSDDELRIEKKSMLGTVYRVLCICLGTPPGSFDILICTGNNESVCDRGLSPIDFYDKYVCVDLSQYVSLINMPSEEKPYMRCYAVRSIGNVAEASPARYVNVDMADLKAAVLAQLQGGETVWFGCDGHHMRDDDTGAMQLAAYDYEDLFSTEFGLNKIERVEYGASKTTSVMEICGVNFDENNNPASWHVSDYNRGKSHSCTMTDAWFDEYIYQAVIHKKYLPESLVQAFASEPFVVSPWEPIMGAMV